ncbi:MAG: GAF and ANTAR domain-containing protein [Actinomycetota bacterium]|nr:GAF and ANTAR domain-containing protein [Actinomycetota bacterium]
MEPADLASPQSALTFAQLARELAAETDVEQTLDRVVKLALETGRCDYASVSFHFPDNRVETVATSHAVVAEADALQHRLGEGPCLDASWGDETYVAEDVRHDSRWPRWGPRAADLGLSSLLAVRLFTSTRNLGALNLYSGEPRRYEHEELMTAQVLGAHTSVAVAAARHELDLWRAVDSRHLIGQAQGILMERFNLGADQAFAVLRRYSQHHNRKLRVVAQELIETRRLPDGISGG